MAKTQGPDPLKILSPLAGPKGIGEQFKETTRGLARILNAYRRELRIDEYEFNKLVSQREMIDEFGNGIGTALSLYVNRAYETKKSRICWMHYMH
jgi:hypothetical protein